MVAGISSATFYPLETEKAVDLAISLGFKDMEIFINSECEFDEDYIRKLRVKLDESGVRVRSLHPYTSAIEALYFFTQYSRRAVDAIKIYTRYFKMAQILGATMFTFHGYRNIITGNAPLDDGVIDRHCEVLLRLSDAAADYGISITQENVSWCASANPQYLRRLREELGDKIGFTFDLKQACRANVPFEEYLSAMGNRIMNIHISDFSTDNTCLLPGNGTLDFNYFFKCLREYSYDGPLIIETYSSAFDNIRQIESSKLWLEHQMVGF